MKNFSVKSIGQVINDQEEIAIQLSAEYVAGLSGLNGFSHLVVLWWPNQMDSDEARSMLEVPKPYKNAPDTMGIFATRSPARPNPIAMTVVDILSIDETTGRIIVPYIDALDGTPVLDLKPYTPSADKVEQPGVPEWSAHWPENYESSGDFDWENEFMF